MNTEQQFNPRTGSESSNAMDEGSVAGIGHKVASVTAAACLLFLLCDLYFNFLG